VLNQDRLWAPWRIDYIRGAAESSDPQLPGLSKPKASRDGADSDCFLCRAAAIYDSEPSPAAVDRELLVVHRGEHVITVINRYPYNNGHLLIAPLRHVGELGSLTESEQLQSFQTIERFVGILRQHMRPDGFNVGLNLGRVAGAGLPGHLHWHLVPRWSGDNNFMPVVANTRVISQSLESLWELLTGEWSRSGSEPC
jgi:ATP adenylyltransferase